MKQLTTKKLKHFRALKISLTFCKFKNMELIEVHPGILVFWPRNTSTLAVNL